MAALQLVVLWKTLPAALWRNDCRSWCDIVIRVSATVTKGKTSEVKQTSGGRSIFISWSCVTFLR